jgi:uncharacterized integral membrane protein
VATDKQLEILHDHYKETFARIREVEKSRDRLFLWVIGLFVLLSLEIGYPAAIGGALGKVSIAGGEFDLQGLPLPALLTATWVLTLAIALRYCQATVFVARQYPYLHMLEENISPLIRDDKSGPPALDANIYRREGKVYLSEYPLLLNVAWIAYVFVFPVIVIVATLALAFWEWTGLPYPLVHHILDSVIAGMLIALFFFYQIQPGVASLWRKWRTRKRRGKRVTKYP